MFALTTGMGIKTGGIHNILNMDESYCFDFNGVDEYVITTLTGNELMATGEFTIAAWVRFDDGVPSGGTEHICGVEHGAYDKIELWVTTGGDPKFQLMSDVGDNTTAVWQTPLDNGDTGWIFIAAKLQIDAGGSNAYISVNGGDWHHSTQADFVPGEFSSSKNIYLGANNDDDTAESFMAGRIASIAFFDIALSQGALSNLYNAGVGADPKYIGSLLAWYRMGDDSSDVIGTVKLDDCSTNKTSEWTESGAATLAFVAANGGGEYAHYTITTTGIIQYVSMAANKTFYAGKRYRFEIDVKDGSVEDYEGTIVLGFPGETVLQSYTTDDEWETIAVEGICPTTTTVGYAAVACTASMSGSNIKIRDAKLGQSSAFGSFITNFLTDASGNGRSGLPTNMENNDIVEDAP